MNIFATLKTYGAAILGFLLAIVTAFFYREKAARATEQKKAVEKAREVESKATDALTEGLKHEQDAISAARARRSERLRDKSNSR